MRPMRQATGLLRRSARNECGAVTAELAIILPFLVLMFASVAEIGRYFQTYTTLSKSTRAAARYLSNHQINDDEKNRARSLVLCGKLDCEGDPDDEGDDSPMLVKGIGAGNICIEYIYPEGSPKAETVTVSIPHEAGDCAEGATPYNYRPVFDLGALLGNSFRFDLPISPSTTMYYILD